MPEETQVDPESVLGKAWAVYEKSNDYKSSLKWAEAVVHPHLQGSLWALFERGFRAGYEAGRASVAEQETET